MVGELDASSKTFKESAYGQYTPHYNVAPLFLNGYNIAI